MITELKRWFEPRSDLSPEEVQKGLRFVVGDGICSSAMGALQGGAFLVAFALALGATNFEIGILAAVGFFLLRFRRYPLYTWSRGCATERRLRWPLLLPAG